MRGHQALIAMRLRGVCPSAAFLTVGTDPDKLWQDWPTANPWSVIAQVEIPERDALTSLDFRFLVGLPVHVHGKDADRTLKVAQMSLDAGAKAVCVVTTGDFRGAYIGEGETQWRDF
jgi:hypothetical protein